MTEDNNRITTPEKFWIFHTSYWIFVAIVLFLYGFFYGHWEIALIRNIYIAIIGFSCSYFLHNIYIYYSPDKFGKRLTLVILLSMIAALISALLINPVTYSMLGYDIQNLQITDYLQHSLYYVLIYIVWSLLFFQLAGQALGSIKKVEQLAGSYIKQITVEKENCKLSLIPDDICYIKANGDYVEFFTNQTNYLKQGTIGYYEEALENNGFVRIHRSIIINKQKIQSVSGPSKGQYWVNLGESHEVRSSRKYQKTIKQLIPKAI